MVDREREDIKLLVIRAILHVDFIELIENLRALSIQPNIPKMATNGTDISWESFHRNREFLNSRKVNSSTENSGNFGKKVEWNGKFPIKKIILKIFVYLAKSVSFHLSSR